MYAYLFPLIALPNTVSSLKIELILLTMKDKQSIV